MSASPGPEKEQAQPCIQDLRPPPPSTALWKGRPAGSGLSPAVTRVPCGAGWQQCLDATQHPPRVPWNPARLPV